MKAKTLAFSIAAAAGLLAAPALSIDALAIESVNPPADAAQAQTPPGVLTLDQKVEGNSVTIKYLYLPTNGYVAIYGSDEDGNRTGNALGYVPLDKGDHRDVPVKLTDDVKPGAVLWTSLYHDVDGDKKLDTQKDKPFWSAAELPPSGRFVVQG